MRCGEVREYLFAFLDSELEAPHSMELQGHLERCPHCAREAEIERAVRHRLEKSIEAECGDLPFEPERLAGLLARPGAPARASARRWLLPAFGVAAAIAVAAAGLWIALRPRDGEPFAEMLASESESFLESRGPLHIGSSDRGAVMEWLRGKTYLHLTLPEPSDASWTLIGGRKCSLAGRPAAFALYELDGVTASLVVLSGEGQEVSAMQPAQHGGRSFCVSRCGERNVVALQHEGLVYSTVSSLPPAQLFDLLGSIKP